MREHPPRSFVAGRWLVAGLVPASAIVIGAQHTTTLVVLTLVAAVAAWLLWIDPPTHITRASRWVILASLVLLIATFIQIVPMPAPVTSVLAPGSADIWQRSLTPFREAGPSWHALSLAPAATHVEFLRGLFYLCTFLSALRIALSEGGSRFLESVVIASTGVVALSTLGHAAVHAERVFGIYAPREVEGFTQGRVGPILNQNHVAAYCNVGAIVSLGVALRERDLARRIAAAAAATLTAGTSVWAGSRGGMLTLVIGLMLVPTIEMVRKSRQARHRAAALETGVVVMALLSAAVLLALASSDAARAELTTRDVSKLHNAQTAFRLVGLSPIIGIGRGAFETVFPLVHEGTTYYRFIRPENVVAQWIVEWGTPLAAVAFAMFAFALRPASVLRAERASVGAWVAVVVAVLHDLVDFHLEVPGVVAAVALCVAAAVGRRPSRDDRKHGAPSAIVAKRLSRAVPLVACAAAGLALPGIGHTVAEDRDAIADLALDRSIPDTQFAHELRTAMLRYPAEAFFPLAGAVHAQVLGRDSVVGWIGRALELSPTFGRAHLVLARSLAPRHRSQARLEYRFAYRYDVALRSAVLREAPVVVEDFDSALELVEEGVAGVDMLEALAGATYDRLPATSAKLDAEITAREPDASGPLRRRVRASMSDFTNEHPWCSDGKACLAEGEDAARRLVAKEPDRCEPRVLQAKLVYAAGEKSRALDTLASALGVVAERAACLRELVSLSLQAGDRRRADAALDQVLRSGCGTREECVDLYRWGAEVEHSRGNTVRAIALLKRSSEIAAESDADLKRIGELAEQARLVGEAIDAYRKLAMRHPDQPDWERRAEALRAKAAEPVLPPH